jgi:peptidyl-prolyl cis-trans isomerase SurA
MAEFGTGKFDYAFEKEVFSLAKDGDVSRPFTTSFGIHIVKRLGFTPMPTDKNDNSLQFDLRQKTMQDSRISSAKEKFAKDIISKIGFKKEAAVKEADLLRYADSAMINPDPEYVQKLPIYNKTIIRFAKGDAKGSDWLKFVKEYKENYSQYKGEPNVELWSKYQTIASLEYYKKHLEEYNEDFRFQMLEFKEGNMLFEIMEKNVWSKASGDSIGLLKYYNANKENYKWAASADVLIFNAVNEKAAQDAMTALQDGKSWRAILENANGELQADSGRYELEQLTGNSQAAPQKNSFSAITKNADGTAMFIKYMNIYEPNQQRNFEDARGLVINDYQIVLEKEWLQELRKKYPVKVNEAVLKTILK